MGNKSAARTGKIGGRKRALTQFADRSASVVHLAAGILEKEIAAGIKAAQDISARSETALERSPDPAQTSLLGMIDRFEKDGQEAVSVLATLLRILAKALEKTTEPRLKQDKLKD
ncbi:MAG: hypothetical protein JO166_15040 [Deltaproteobacteria bacterium]|nr:hypothetical protein [Deltaproteobacteria bacterium]